MSEPNAVQQEQEAPIMRETATGPLLPEWFTRTFYVVFAVFCVYSAIHITRSSLIQRSIVGALEVIAGSAERESADLEGAEGQQAVADLLERPKRAFLYLNQALLQPEEEDLRMARVHALHKAVAWGVNSARRQTIDDVLANMSDEGQISTDFSLTEDMRAALADLVAERRADLGMTYAEDQITDLLAWLVAGYPGKPKGPEQRRLRALREEYKKKVFVGRETKALKALMEEWQGSTKPGQAAAAKAFGVMLGGRPVGLDAEAEAACRVEAERWKALYRDGMISLAGASRKTAQEIARLTAANEVRAMDHPHLYQYMSLLDHQFAEVRHEVSEGCWALRFNRFAFMFLSEFATRTAINPSMAVETARFTREEHEREMTKANRRRMKEAIDLLARVAIDYITDPSPYRLNVADDDEFVRKQVVGRLQEIVDEETVGSLAEAALQRVREADMARPGGPILFTAA